MQQSKKSRRRNGQIVFQSWSGATDKVRAVLYKASFEKRFKGEKYSDAKHLDNMQIAKVRYIRENGVKQLTDLFNKAINMPVLTAELDYYFRLTHWS